MTDPGGRGGDHLSDAKAQPHAEQQLRAVQLQPPAAALGQQLGEGPDGLCYLIASPTKALVDRMVLSQNLASLSQVAMLEWLLEDLRLDEGLLSGLSLEEIRRYQASGFKQRQSALC